MREKIKRTEVWFKLILLVLFGFLYFLAIPYPEQSKQFPHLIAISILILILISLVIDFTKKDTMAREIGDADDIELKVLDETTKKKRKERFYRAWSIILISTAAGFLGGFLFSAFFFFLGFALLFGKKKDLTKNIILTVAMTILIYLTFQRIMGVPLLEGILW